MVLTVGLPDESMRKWPENVKIFGSICYIQGQQYWMNSECISECIYICTIFPCFFFHFLPHHINSYVLIDSEFIEWQILSVIKYLICRNWQWVEKRKFFFSSFRWWKWGKKKLRLIYTSKSFSAKICTYSVAVHLPTDYYIYFLPTYHAVQ